MKHLRLKITALLFGIGIWFYAISLQDFKLTLEVPLIFARLPETLAIASKPPETISVQVTGHLVDLIRMRSDKKRKTAVIIDARQVEQGWSHFTLSAENFSAPDFPEIHYIEGDRIRSVDVEFDTKIHRKIPVQLNTVFEPAPGFTFVGLPKTEPEAVEIFGARTTVSKIQNIRTKKGVYANLTENADFELALDFDSLPNYIFTKDTTVRVKIPVQPIARKKLTNIPVHLIGMFDKEKYSLEPSTAEIEIIGGREILKNIQSEKIDVFIEFNRFAIENADKLTPTIRIAETVKDIQIQPEKFTLVEKTDSLVTPALKDSSALNANIENAKGETP